MEVKKIWTISLLFSCLLSGMAQNGITNFSWQYCSAAKKSYFSSRNLENIIQTPLLNYYDVTFYFLDLHVENHSIELSGSVTIHAFVTAETLDTFAVELVDELVIDSIILEGINTGFIRLNNEVFVPLQNPLLENDDFICTVFYHGIPPTGGFFSGISSAYDSTWQKNVTWTLSEPFNARQWWPTKQVLTDKADSSWVFITTSDENRAGSNGILTAVVPLPDNKVRYEWKSQFPIDYYLISFAVADYQDYSIYAHPEALSGDSVLIQTYIYDSPECLSAYKQSIEETDEMIELFSDLYGLYPFHEEKYGHCLAGLSGGMEHQTMTTLGWLQFDIVAHELAHSWFGDNVTCSNWSDIWINEGFATYSDFLALDMIAGDPWPEVWKSQVHSYVMSEPGGSIYVPEDEVTYENVERIFDSRLSYCKGALMLHMIRFELQDDELFFQVMKNFQIAFADSTASATDFLNTLNQTSGMDFTGFFEQWYYGEGYPVYSITWKHDNDLLEITSVQTTSKPETTPLFKMHLPFRIYFGDGSDTTCILNQQNNHELFSIPVSKTIDSIRVDPEKWVLKKVESIIGIQELSHSDGISIYPNPVSETLKIESPHNSLDDVRITDIAGNPVNVNWIGQPSGVLDVSGLKPGFYFISVRNETGVHTVKVIKLR